MRATIIKPVSIVYPAPIMPAVLLAFIAIDGLAMRNPSAWAAPARAGTLLAMFVCGVWLALRAGVRVRLPAAALIGLVAAMAISDAYQQPVMGLTLWLVYVGCYALQARVQRDWTYDFALAGTALALVTCLYYLVNRAEPPMGMWNKNVIGGILVVLLPSAAVLPSRAARITALVVMLCGIIVTASRGALMGTFAVLAVLYQPWALLVAPVCAIPLILARPLQSGVRLDYWRSALDTLAGNATWGVGAGRILLPSFDARPCCEVHAHNSLLSIALQVGGLGIAAVVGALGLSQRPRWQRWQIAALAGVAVQSLVDDPLTWLPVGVILAITLATQQEEP